MFIAGYGIGPTSTTSGDPNSRYGARSASARSGSVWQTIHRRQLHPGVVRGVHEAGEHGQLVRAVGNAVAIEPQQIGRPHRSGGRSGCPTTVGQWTHLEPQRRGERRSCRRLHAGPHMRSGSSESLNLSQPCRPRSPARHRSGCRMPAPGWTSASRGLRPACRPATPVVEMAPPVTARPCLLGLVRSRSFQVAPPWCACRAPRSGVDGDRPHLRQVDHHRRPRDTQRPATLWPPPRTAISRPFSCSRTAPRRRWSSVPAQLGDHAPAAGRSAHRARVSPTS